LSPCVPDSAWLREIGAERMRLVRRLPPPLLRTGLERWDTFAAAVLYPAKLVGTVAAWTPTITAYTTRPATTSARPSIPRRTSSLVTC
jgi:hypothetical protein